MERELVGFKIWTIYRPTMIKKSLCSKKILLVLDDVDRLDQLKELAGEQGWSGLGSRIIATTRDEHVLVTTECIRYLRLRKWTKTMLVSFFAWIHL